MIDNCIWYNKNKLDISFLVGTTNNLLLFEGTKITNLANGNVYGITQKNDYWYFTLSDKVKNSGKIYCFSKNDILNHKLCMDKMNFGLHQIDFIGKQLFVTNTFYDSISVYNSNTNNPYELQFCKEIFPNKRLINTIKTSNEFSGPLKDHGHYNSIYGHNNLIKILAHNVSTKTGKNSEIFTYDKELNFIESKILSGGKNCHNIYDDNYHLLVCNSAEGTVTDFRNNSILFKCDKFTRGLSISDDYIIIGGTTNSLQNKSARKAESSIYILSKDWTLVDEICLKGCEINEIRGFNIPDYGLSNTGSKKIL